MVGKGGEAIMRITHSTSKRVPVNKDVVRPITIAQIVSRWGVEDATVILSGILHSNTYEFEIIRSGWTDKYALVRELEVK